VVQSGYGCRLWCRRGDQRKFFGDLDSGAPDEFSHHRGIQTGRVELHAHRPRSVVKTEAANTVHIARIGQRQNLRLGGRLRVAEQDVHCGHTGIITIKLVLPQSEPLKKSPDLGIGPVGIAYHLAPNDAVAVDDVSLRPAVGAVHFRDCLVGIANRSEIDVEAVEEALICARIFVNAHRENGQVWPFMMQRDERRRFLDAGPAPTGPEIEQNHFAAIIRELDGIRSIRNRKVGGLLADLRGLCAAIATAEQQARGRQKQAKER
jgi:hypothetical protein